MQSRRGFIAGGLAAVAALIGGLSRGGATAARRTHNPEVVGSTPTPAIQPDCLTEAKVRQCIENIRNQRPAWHSDEDIAALWRVSDDADAGARLLTQPWYYDMRAATHRPGTWTP